MASSRALKPADSKKLLGLPVPGEGQRRPPRCTPERRTRRAAASSSRRPRPTPRAPGLHEAHVEHPPALGLAALLDHGRPPPRPPSRRGRRPGTSPASGGEQVAQPASTTGRAVAPGVGSRAAGPRRVGRRGPSGTPRPARPRRIESPADRLTHRLHRCPPRPCRRVPRSGPLVEQLVDPAQDRPPPPGGGLVGPDRHQLGPVQPVEALHHLGGRQGVEPGDGQRRAPPGRGRWTPPDGTGPWTGRSADVRRPAPELRSPDAGRSDRRRPAGHRARRPGRRRGRRSRPRTGDGTRAVRPSWRTAPPPGPRTPEHRSARGPARPAGATPRPPTRPRRRAGRRTGRAAARSAVSSVARRFGSAMVGSPLRRSRGRASSSGPPAGWGA